MKILKKAAAALLAAALVAGTTACSADKSWAAKNSSLTVPIGSYIYYLYNAYTAAESAAPDTSKSVLGQKIENQDATTWIRNKALEYTKALFVIDQKMKDMKLTLTDAEVKQVSSDTDSMWSQYQSALEGFGIAKTSFNLAYTDYYTKYEKVFEATYGKGGPKAVSDADLKDFYVKNYSDFSYFVAPLYKTDSSGSPTPLSDADKKKLEDTFNGYASQIKAGTMTMQQAADAYQKSTSATTSPLQNETINLSTDTNYPDEFKTVVKGMQAGEVQTKEFSDLSLYVIIQKNDVAAKADSQLKDASGRSSILANDKGSEFADEITKEADALQGITVNDAAVNSYDPKMFESASSTAAPQVPEAQTSSAAASSATSSAASQSVTSAASSK